MVVGFASKHSLHQEYYFEAAVLPRKHDHADQIQERRRDHKVTPNVLSRGQVFTCVTSRCFNGSPLLVIGTACTFRVCTAARRSQRWVNLASDQTVVRALISKRNLATPHDGNSGGRSNRSPRGTHSYHDRRRSIGSASCLSVEDYVLKRYIHLKLHDMCRFRTSEKSSSSCKL